MNKKEIKKIYAEERTKFRAKHPDAKLELLFSTSIRDKFIIPFVERCLQTIEEPEEKICDHDYKHISQGPFRPVYCSNCLQEL